MTPYEFLLNYLKERDRLEQAATDEPWEYGGPRAVKIAKAETEAMRVILDLLTDQNFWVCTACQENQKLRDEALTQAAKALGWEESK